MSKLRTLIEKDPEVCGAKNAGRWSRASLLQLGGDGVSIPPMTFHF